MTKAVILCGGFGTRITEETSQIPKPMIKLNKAPILIHILAIYSKSEIKDFIICTGYKNKVIKDFFKQLEIKKNLIRINLSKLNLSNKKNHIEIWKVRVVNTGLHTLTGGRVRRIKKYVENDDFFHVTYGDGVANINLKKIEILHKKQNTICTLTAVKEPSRFGRLNLRNNKVESFVEKPNEYINGGFFVFNNKIFKYLKNDNTVLEKDPLEKISKINQLSAYKHNSFWHPMDTLREKILLEKLCKNKTPLWLK